jgi:ABC-type uncharacterized transport system permease subunit
MSMYRRERLKEIGITTIYYVLAIGAAFLVTGVLLWITKQNILLGYETIFTSSFRSLEYFSLTIFKFIPLYLMGLGFAIPLASKKFNVGIEGQFLLGAIGAAIVGIVFGGLPSYVLVPLILVTAMAFGALWGFIPASLLYYFNVNEIISTILLNFISFYLVDLVALGRWRDQFAGHPMTIPISSAGHMPLIVKQPQIHVGSIVAIILGVLGYILVYKMVFGYELRAAGSNPIASMKFGINVSLLAPLSLVLGGLMAGLAGGIEVAGLHYRLVEGMQSDYASLAIIASLMAKGNPIYLFLTVGFISVLEVGASAMQRTMGAPVEIVFMTEALMMLFIMLAEVFRYRRR